MYRLTTPKLASVLLSTFFNGKDCELFISPLRGVSLIRVSYFRMEARRSSRVRAWQLDMIEPFERGICTQAKDS